MLHSVRHAVGSRRLRRPTLLLACVGALAIIAGPATASTYTIVANGTPVTSDDHHRRRDRLADVRGHRREPSRMRIYGVTMSPKPNTGIKVSIRKPDGTTLVSPFDVGLVRHVHGAGLDARHRHVHDRARRPEHLQGQGHGRALDRRRRPDRHRDAGRRSGAARADAGPERHRHVHRHGRPPREHQALRPSTINGNAVNSARVSVLKPDLSVLVANSNFGSSGGFLEPFTIPATGDVHDQDRPAPVVRRLDDRHRL